MTYNPFGACIPHLDNAADAMLGDLPQDKGGWVVYLLEFLDVGCASAGDAEDMLVYVFEALQQRLESGEW